MIIHRHTFTSKKVKAQQNSILNLYSLLGVAKKLRIVILRCTAPCESILFDFSTKIVATLWLIIQVQCTGNLCRILFGDGDKGAAHRNIQCKVFKQISSYCAKVPGFLSPNLLNSTGNSFEITVGFQIKKQRNGQTTSASGRLNRTLKDSGVFSGMQALKGMAALPCN